VTARAPSTRCVHDQVGEGIGGAMEGRPPAEVVALKMRAGAGPATARPALRRG